MRWVRRVAAEALAVGIGKHMAARLAFEVVEHPCIDFLAEPGAGQATHGTPGQAPKNGARQTTQRNTHRPGDGTYGRTAACTHHRIGGARRRTTRSASSPAHLAGDIARSNTLGIAERTANRHRSDSILREGLKTAIAARLPLGNTGLKIFRIELGHVNLGELVLEGVATDQVGVQVSDQAS